MTATTSPPPKRNLIIVVVPILLVAITFLFWYQTWFGRVLSDQDMTQYLTDASVPHKTQHALTQLAERMARGDPRARQWYPLVNRLAARPEPGFRVMAAWAMGQDNKAEEFRPILLQLLTDPEPMVRRNAALALVRFGDASGREEMRAVLEPSSLLAPATGEVKYRFGEMDPIRSGAAVARIQSADGEEVDVISPVAGRLERRAVRNGARVSAGDLVAVIISGEDQVWEALRALYLVGTAEELPAVDRYARGVEGYSEMLRRQAASTAEAIRKRTASK
jgi:HEAT repeat protein